MACVHVCVCVSVCVCVCGMSVSDGQAMLPPLAYIRQPDSFPRASHDSLRRDHGQLSRREQAQSAGFATTCLQDGAPPDMTVVFF